MPEINNKRHRDNDELEENEENEPKSKVKRIAEGKKIRNITLLWWNGINYSGQKTLRKAHDGANEREWEIRIVRVSLSLFCVVREKHLVAKYIKRWSDFACTAKAQHNYNGIGKRVHTRVFGSLGSVALFCPVKREKEKKTKRNMPIFLPLRKWHWLK